MRRLIAPLVTAVLVIVGYNPVSQWLGSYLPLSVEGKLTMAFPLPTQSQVQIERIKEIDRSKQIDFDNELQYRLKLRALSCSSIDHPHWYQSIAQVRSRYSNPECFTAEAKRIAAWLGLVEVGLLLKQPPVRVTQPDSPSIIQADAFIQSVTFAVGAPVGLFITTKSLQTIDLNTGRVLFQEAHDRSAGFSKLSPNGRLFAENGNEMLSVRNAETGEVLAQLPEVAAYQFMWLDNRTAAYIPRNGSGLTFIDFDNAVMNTTKVTMLLGRVAAVPARPDHYVVLDGRQPSEFELVRSRQALQVNLVTQPTTSHADTPHFSASITGALSADQRSFVSGTESLSLFTLDTQETKTFETLPFTIQEIRTTPDKNNILVRGRVQEWRQRDQELFVFDINAQTVASVRQPEIPSLRVEYASPLNKLAVIDDRRLLLLDQLPTEQPKPLAQWRTELLQMVTDRKLERLNPQNPSVPPYGAVGLVSNPPAPIMLAGLAAGAQVEGVGVYEAANGYSSGNDHKPGTIDVDIRRSLRPIVLVLTSYEPVHWKINRMPGATVTAVILSSYYPSQVEGAGIARVLVAGSNFAYGRGGSGYSSLNRQIMTMIGKPIEMFQGTYSGARFSVGGN
jgi:hypothetical protein